MTPAMKVTQKGPTAMTLRAHAAADVIEIRDSPSPDLLGVPGLEPDEGGENESLASFFVDREVSPSIEAVDIYCSSPRSLLSFPTIWLRIQRCRNSNLFQLPWLGVPGVPNITSSIVIEPAVSARHRGLNLSGVIQPKSLDVVLKF
ncbi:hypothetical protein B0H15DRAFT_798298 [Mycena belliarum]|uniref:Uncharacterized protein n=1 Tax=Mycena belliarum TaxID=1033014 RepID=A0AAD6U9H5_9AGAR|nr:hypothetical protein B0H15DRAFT_798298 [Mycena belliae]